MEVAGPVDEVVAVEGPWRPRSGARPVLFQDGDRAVVVFDAARPPGEGVLTRLKRSAAPTVGAPSPQAARIELRFEDCLATRFGYPDEAALSGHPLFERGLGPDGLFEVHGSSWLASLVEQSREQSRAAGNGTRRSRAEVGQSWPPFPVHHFVATFNGATFECLCASVRGRATDLSVAEIVESLTR
jgi:hypothetical protein